MGKRRLEQLTAIGVRALKKPGRYPDGRNLYLQITRDGVKSWVLRYERNGVEKMMGLGPVHDVGLKDARERARLARVALLDGIDPLEAKRAQRATAAAAAARELTFDEAATRFIAAHEAGWKNAKHRQQIENTLATYASPVIGAMRVRNIGVPDVMKVLNPIWRTKTETARRVRMRIEAVLDWCTVGEFRQGPNPAAWKGKLQTLLPAPEKLKVVKHHPALPYKQIGPFCAALRAQPGQAARALELTILAACRTSEVLNAQWSEFDLDAALWVIPAARMKMGKEHRVPLSPRAVEIIRGQIGMDDTYVWPGAKPGQPLSNMAMLAALKRMSRSDVTVHGFRSTFRDWAAETTDAQNFVVEMALAHKVESETEGAYRRGDLFDKRRALMEAWAAACGAEPGISAPKERR